jgi:hypothetical protein
MDIRALVHRHAEAVMFPTCRIRHIDLLCFALMAFLSPRQLGAMDDSDEELQSINNVARLDSQLEEAGCPCDETLCVHLFRDLDGKPLAKRSKLWRFRKELLRQKLVAFMLSRSALSAASGNTAATSPPVVKQETKHKENWRSLHLRALQHNYTTRGQGSNISNTPMGRRRSCCLFMSLLQQNL